MQNPSGNRRKRAQKAAEKGELEDEGAHDMAVASFGREDYAAAATFFEAALGAGSPHSAFEGIVARVISTSYIVRPATADGNEEQLYSHMATENYLADWGLVT